MNSPGASAGAGIRFFLPDDLQVDPGVAVPLSYRAPDNGRRSPRLLFTLSSVLRLCPERGKIRLSLAAVPFGQWPPACGLAHRLA